MSKEHGGNNESLVPAGLRDVAPAATNLLVWRGLTDLAKGNLDNLRTLVFSERGTFWNRFHREWGNAGSSHSYVKDNWNFMQAYVETHYESLDILPPPEKVEKLVEELRRTNPASAQPTSTSASPEHYRAVDRQTAVADMSREELLMELLERPFRVKHPLGIGFWDCFKLEWGNAVASAKYDSTCWDSMRSYVEALVKCLAEVREKLHHFGLEPRAN